MTLTRFVSKNAFRNKRRSILTVLSVGFSLLLLTMMMSIWRSFYVDNGSQQSALRLITRHKVSLTFEMPAFYREKIRALPGVAEVVPMNWFGGNYKDANKSQNFFAQFGTDPDEFFKVYPEWKIPPDQLEAWQKDRAGAIVDPDLAKKYGWKIGDHIIIQGATFPVDLELTIRGIYTPDQATNTLYYNQKYVEEAVSFLKGQTGFFSILAQSPQDVGKIGPEVDDMFRNSPQPTKTETEKAFQLGFVAMLGNVKAFILSICSAVVFAILLVSANTMAMSIRERTREVAVLKTLGFTRPLSSVYSLGKQSRWLWSGEFSARSPDFCSAAVRLRQLADSSEMPSKFIPRTMLVAWVVAALVGFLSAIVPSYNASRIGIVDGLRHIG